MKDISIVIVSYNAKEYLKICLQSIFQFPPQSDFEVIVVDNNSSEGNVEMLKQEFSSVIVIRNNENVGFARANNQGIKVAQGKYVLLLNPDTKLIENIFSPLSNFMDIRTSVAIAGCRILNDDGTEQGSFFPFPNLLTTFLNAFFLDRIISYQHIDGRNVFNRKPLTQPVKVDWVSGAFMFCKKDSLLNIGLIDERYPLYSEEVDLCYAAYQNGYEVYTFPSVSIIHYGGRSTFQQRTKTTILANLSKLLFIQKHYSNFTQIVFRIIFFLGLFLRLIGALLIPLSNRQELKTIYLESLKIILR
ncbi:MAG: glycosyltransferase family 2 protein [Ignavibacteriales bacterium]|nr:glycosyltransferase family 2 protein [Ignavibacteriales bacterium]